MEDAAAISVSENATILDALRVMEESGLQIALVVGEMGRLLGTITDGDVRRSMLQGRRLDGPVHTAMNPRPLIAGPDDTRDAIWSMMRNNRLHHIPVVDRAGCLLGIEVLKAIAPARDNAVVLMAGGLGQRLRPLTANVPKALLQVGSEKPLLETVVENFVDHGFRRFYLAVNYKAEMVEAHFGDGSRWGARIEYLREKSFLGTAGALSLLPERPDQPFILMNGDILTKVNFSQLLDFHVDHAAQTTVCIRDYQMQVPYGVVRINDHWVHSIEEKPFQGFFVNAGIYVFDPNVIDLVPHDRRFDATDLINASCRRGDRVAAFPIREYWVDIGRHIDFERATTDAAAPPIATDGDGAGG